MTLPDTPIKLEERIGAGQPPDEVMLLMQPRLVKRRITQTRTFASAKALLYYLLRHYTNIYYKPELAFGAVQPNGEVAEAHILSDPTTAQTVADALSIVWEMRHRGYKLQPEENNSKEGQK